MQIFWTKIDQSFDAVSKSIVYLFSHIDHKQKLQRIEPLLNKSPFYNNHTKILINYLRSKYEEENFDLNDGRMIIEKFMTNFGVRFEDIGNNQYHCHVLDI